MTTFNDTFLKVCRGEDAPHTPIWLMRQAGRYLPEYRELREKHRMLEMCRTPELAAEVTMQPLRRFALDAAILFSDITMPYYGMNVAFDIKEGVGPVIEKPIRTVRQATSLPEFDVEAELPFVLDTVRLLAKELKVPLIGFAGAPFTMAAYLIEGKPSRDFPTARKFMYCEPEAWHELMRVLSVNTLNYLKAQIAAGAQVVQVFDSWVGGLHPDTYREYLLPHMKFIFDGLKEEPVPTIHFGTGTAALLPILKEAGGDVLGVDWKTPFSLAREHLGSNQTLQGNLDPALLSVPFDVLKPFALSVLEEGGKQSGHIFNLGHGIMPDALPDNVARLVDLVHEETSR
jgi:uroporphyrinogen decarboxylase